MADASVICVMIILIITFTIILLLQKKPMVISRPLGFLALLSFCLLIFVIMKANGLGRFMVKTTGNPRESLEIFYDGIVNKNYDVSYSLLYDTKTLGFEDFAMQGSDSLSANELLVNALVDSYSYEIVGEPVVNDLSARAKVKFNYLDLYSFEENVSGRIDSVITGKIRTMKKAELYDEEGNYKEEVLNDVYEEALKESLEWKEKYYTSVMYDVELIYENDMWLIKYNDDMTNSFAGGMIN